MIKHRFEQFSFITESNINMIHIVLDDLIFGL